MRDIKAVLKGIYGTKSPFPYIRREKPREYSLEDAIAEVEEIGKVRDPDFCIDDFNRDAYVSMIQWIHNDPAMICMNPEDGSPKPGDLNRGIYIAGGPGSGKSWLLDVMTVYTGTLGFRVDFNGYVRHLKWSNIRTSKVCDNFLRTGDLSAYKDVDIIGFQDLGSEHLETLYMGTRVEVMREILESRGDDETKLVMITSNLKIADDQLVKMYGQRVGSRLRSMCNYIELTGPDRRRR